MKRKLFFLAFILFLLFVFFFPTQIFSREEKECKMPKTIGNISDAAEMENCAERATRPFGLGEQKHDWFSLCRLSGLPIVGSLLEKICLFREDSQDLQRLVPKKVQITPAPPPQDVATQSAKTEEEAKGILESIIGWLVKIIASFTIKKESGHIAASLPEKLNLAPIKTMGETKANLGADIVFGFDTLKRAFTPYSLLPKPPAEYTPPPEVILSPVPSLPPLPLPPAVTSLGEIIKASSDWTGVPWGVIEAMAMIEGRHLFNYSDDQIQKYSQPGEKDPINCSPNICSAAGPMQLTTGKENADCEKCPAACDYDPNAWEAYKNAVNEATGEGRKPEVCNIKDSIFAAAKKMKIDSGTPFGEKGDWGKETVRRVATRYYGECWCCPSGGDWQLCKPGKEEETPACKRLGKSYCEFVWEYYQAHK